MRFAGVDIHKKYSTIVLTDESGNRLAEHLYQTSARHFKPSLGLIVSPRKPC